MHSRATHTHTHTHTHSRAHTHTHEHTHTHTHTHFCFLLFCFVRVWWYTPVLCFKYGGIDIQPVSSHSSSRPWWFRISSAASQNDGNLLFLSVPVVACWPVAEMVTQRLMTLALKPATWALMNLSSETLRAHTSVKSCKLRTYLIHPR